MKRFENLQTIDGEIYQVLMLHWTNFLSMIGLEAADSPRDTEAAVWKALYLQGYGQAVEDFRHSLLHTEDPARLSRVCELAIQRIDAAAKEVQP